MEISHIDFYSGSKGEESPRKIYTSSGIITVKKIIETKLEENFCSKERKRVFIFQSQKKDFYQLNIYKNTFEIKQIEMEEKHF
jgi:hypothetical protein